MTNSAKPDPHDLEGSRFAAALACLNDLVTEGIVTNYAVCGAVASLFYAEPVSTYDIDVYAFLPSTGPLVDLSELYRWARQRGFESHGEHVVIHSVPVQILASPDELIDEGIEKAQTILVGDAPVRVMAPEFLVAIALQTHRTGKDYERVRLLLESKTVDRQVLEALIVRYKLTEWWHEYLKRYE